MTTDEAYKELCEGTSHIFLTGNAGTGKTTLIKKFIEEHPNQCIVVAPTGVAAVNAGGETIHRFFQLPARTVSFAAVKYLDPNNPFDQDKRNIIKHAKYLIIDEVSMVRADLMDAMSWFLTKSFSKPFGHLKLIMVGDVSQLPPVVASEEEKEMIANRYESEFFFSAEVWREHKFKTIHLTKVWRQSDPVFIKFLSDIKNNCLSTFDLDRFNLSCVAKGELDPDMGIMLCTTNKIANEINAVMLSWLDSTPVYLEGTIKGDFEDKNCPVDKIIELKIGAKVMITRNGPGYYNGMIGEFLGKNLDDDAVLDIKIGAYTIQLPIYEFTSGKYTYDAADDSMKHEDTGSFFQYPIKLAYAITIHKSQGATFDKVIIDIGDRGAFAHGQIYVALSRARTMEGITLRRPIAMKDLIYSETVKQFNKYGQDTVDQYEKEDDNWTPTEEDLPF